MLNILIAEGTPAVWQAERAGFGLPSNFSLVAGAVQLHQPGAHCAPLNIADGEAGSNRAGMPAIRMDPAN
jgi:hypothetical protein